MSLRIALFLTLLVLPSLARKSILKEYSLKKLSTNSSVVELTGKNKYGLVLKVSSDEKPFNATLKVLIKNSDGVVISPQVLKFFAGQNETTCSENRDILQLKSPNKTKTPTFCSSDSSDDAKDKPGFLFEGSEVTISYNRRENSTSSFDLTLTAFNSSCKLRQFRCANGICIPAAMKCDERDNCGDKSDERWCFIYMNADYIVLYVLLAIVALAVVVCIVCACISCCRRRNVEGPRQPNPVPNAQPQNQGQPFGVPYGAVQPPSPNAAPPPPGFK